MWCSAVVQCVQCSGAVSAVVPVVQWCSAMVRWCVGAVGRWCIGAVQWCGVWCSGAVQHGAVVQWCGGAVCGAVVQRCSVWCSVWCSAVVQCVQYSGAVVPVVQWCSGAVVQWCSGAVQWCGGASGRWGGGAVVQGSGAVVQCSGAVVRWGGCAVVQCSGAMVQWCSAVLCGAVQCLFWGIVPPKRSPHQWFSWARLEFPGIPQEFLFLEFLREIPSPTSEAIAKLTFDIVDRQNIRARAAGRGAPSAEQSGSAAREAPGY